MNNFGGIVLFTLLLLLSVGCTEKKATKTQDENIQTIVTVLQKSFNGPSDELKQIMDKESEEKVEALNQYEENLFKNYFANETSYTEFVNSYGSTLMIEPIKNNYKFKINNIEYEKVDEKDNIYNFSVELQSQTEGSEKSEVKIVTGQANLNAEHKIEAMLIRIKDLYNR